MKTIHYELRDGIATITFDEAGSPVNTMCEQWQSDLTEVTAQVVKDKDAIRGIVLASAKSTFFAGADLKATMRLQPSDAPRVFREIEQTKKNFRTLETLGQPVASCLNGTALGGGWEVALIGHYRVAVDDRKIQFGLPELTLGLIPGASGITKMTRLLGLMGAQPYILESKLFHPREALELGLVHELVADAAALRPAALAWIEQHAGSGTPVHHPWDDKNYKMPGGTPSNPKIAGMLAVAPAMLKRKTRGLYPAPEYALAAMVEGAQVDFDTALRIESRYLAKLIVSPVAKNMINTFFFNLNAIKAGQSRPGASSGPGAIPRWKPQKVGILGAGMMGGAIAYVQAGRGIATRAARRHGREGASRPRLQPQADATARRQGPHERAGAAGAAGADHADRLGAGPARLRPDHRGRVREPRPEGARHAGSRADARAGRHLREQHLDAADHRTGQGEPRSGQVRRHPLLQPGRQDEAGGDHPRTADRRRNRGPRLRLRAGPRQDPDRGQRLARLLHLARVRHAS